MDLPALVLQEKQTTLNEVLPSKDTNEAFMRIKDKLKDYPADKPFRLIKQEFHNQIRPTNYMSRILLHRTELDESIFSHPSTKYANHVFTFKKGVRQTEIFKVVGCEDIRYSEEQMEKLTSQYIMLQINSDYKTICSKHNARPIHMLEYKRKNMKDTYHWVKSTDGVDIIRNFIRGDGEKLTEENVVDRILRVRSPRALIIADSPGIGKTFLLFNLAIKLREKNPAAIVLMIDLQDFFQWIADKEISRSDAFDTIAAYISTDSTAHIILYETFKNVKYKFYFLFDGYDEVMQNNLEKADSLLQQLLGRRNFTSIVATRNHLTSHLETLLRRLSYQILPYTLDDKKRFLLGHWVHYSKHKARNSKTLHEFCSQCLEKLDPNLKSIIGTPLQCQVFAEINSENVKRVSRLSELPEDAFKTVKTFDMFGVLVEQKFDKIKKSKIILPQDIPKYRDAHYHYSILLLFPNWTERLKLYLPHFSEISEDPKIYSIGLIERNLNSGRPKFLHRLFAEYLAANFVIGILRKSKEKGIVLELLFTEVLKQETKTSNNIERHGETSMLELKQFLNMEIKNDFEGDVINEYSISTQDLSSITEENVCGAIVTCCTDNLEHCFNFTVNILDRFSSSSIIVDKIDLRDKYFKDLPYLSVSNDSLLRNVLSLTKSKFGVNLSYHALRNPFILGESICMPVCTLFHYAANKADYNMAMYLLREYKEDILSMGYLLHVCVHNSAKNNDKEVENKTCIIQALNSLDSKWLNEDYKCKPPLLQENVHINYLKLMVELGANINTCNDTFGTILHTSGAKDTYTHLVEWALRDGFNRINASNSLSMTPLMDAIYRFKTVPDRVIKLFKKHGADFNAKDSNGNSVLFYAIQYSNSVGFITRIINAGADPGSKNKNSETAAHIVITLYRRKIKKALKLLKLFGLTMLKEKNKDGETPIMKAIKSDIHDNDLIKLFVEAGVDEDGNSVLFHAYKCSKDANLVKKIIAHGADVNIQNKKGQNAAHFILKHNSDTNLVFNQLQLLVKNGFKSFYQTDRNGVTPVSIGIKSGNLHDDALKLFVKAGVDKDKNSFLFHAIQSTSSEDLITKLIDLGEDVHHRNNAKENAGHFVFKNSANNKRLISRLLKALAFKGFVGFNESNINSETPISIAISNGIVDDDMLKLFVEAGVDTKGDSVLFHVLKNRHSINIIEKILGLNVDVNHRNSIGENAAHLAIKCYEQNPQLVLEILKMLDSREFNGYKDKHRDTKETPQKLAKHFKEEEIRKFWDEKDKNCSIQ